MANIAECAIAIALEDLPKLNGAIRKRKKGEESRYYCETKYKDKDGESYIFGHSWHEKDGETYELKKNNHSVFFTKDWHKIHDKMQELGLTTDITDPNYYTSKIDICCDGEWAVDWAKLHAFSYDYTPLLEEYEDHITIIFGGRWDFPEALETFLNSLDIKWQGAGCEDGCDWQFDDYGTYDFGLRIGRERDNCDGEDYYYHYVYDTNKTRSK